MTVEPLLEIRDLSVAFRLGALRLQQAECGEHRVVLRCALAQQAVHYARIDLEGFAQIGEFTAREPHRTRDGEREPCGDPGQAVAQANRHVKIVTWVISFFM